MTSGRMLVWTICLYKIPDLAEDEFHRYLSEHHAPMVRECMLKHGIQQYTMTHNTSKTRKLMAEMGTPQDEGLLDYDLITQIRVPDVQCLVNMKNDPFFKEKVLADNGRFTDPTRVFMTIGWVHDHIAAGALTKGSASIVG